VSQITEVTLSMRVPTRFYLGVILLSSIFTLGINGNASGNSTDSVALPLPTPVEFSDDVDTSTTDQEPLSPAKIQITNSAEYAKELKCMSRNIYFEARNQSKKGQIAIALVTLNRVAHKRWPSTICGVVKQHKQFSWYSDGKSDKPRNKKAFIAAQLIASTLMSRETTIIDFTKGSTHYHADYVDPYWNRKLVKLATIGTHIFYKYP